MTPSDAIAANLPLLRELRDRLGQLELAKRVGVSRRTIARLESGEVADPGVALMGRIAEALSVSLPLLLQSELELITLALPDDVCARLESERGPEVLDVMIRAARQLPES